MYAGQRIHPDFSINTLVQSIVDCASFFLQLKSNVSYIVLSSNMKSPPLTASSESDADRSYFIKLQMAENSSEVGGSDFSALWQAPQDIGRGQITNSPNKPRTSRRIAGRSCQVTG